MCVPLFKETHIFYKRYTEMRFSVISHLLAAAATWLDLLEEVVALVINEDECREVLNLNLPDSLHAELWVLNALDALDIVLREDSCRTTD